MVFGTGALARDLLVHMCLAVGPLWIGLFPVRPADAQSDWDVGTLEAGKEPWALCSDL